MRIAVRAAAAASELDIRREILDEYTDADDQPTAALLRAWDGKAITLTDANRALVVEGLNDLSNHCDRLADETSLSDDERTHNRHASKALATLYFKVYR